MLNRNDAFQVSWQRPESLFAYYFRLYMCEESQGNWLKIIEGKDVCDLVAEDLKPATRYAFKSQSYGMAGDGPFCDSISVVTLPCGALFRFDPCLAPVLHPSSQQPLPILRNNSKLDKLGLVDRQTSLMTVASGGKQLFLHPHPLCPSRILSSGLIFFMSFLFSHNSLLSHL